MADLIHHSSFLVHTFPTLALGLWGLPLFTASAGAAPIIIHLLNRLRFDRVRWAAMDFLLQSRKRNRRRVQIEQLILLAIRVLIMLLLAAAFARLAWGPDPAKSAAAAEGGPESHFVLLDVSMSMGAKDDSGATGLSKGTGFVRDLLRKIKPGDDFSLVLVGKMPGAPKSGDAAAGPAGKAAAAVEGLGYEPERKPAPLAEGDAEAINARLADLRPTDTEADFNLALDLLARTSGGTEVGLLTEPDPRRKRIVHIVTDFRRPGWGPDAAGPVGRRLEQIRGAFKAVIDPVDLASKSPPVPDNLAITAFAPSGGNNELTVYRGATVPADRDIKFLVRVKNYGAREQTAGLEAFVDGKRQAGTAEVTVPPGGEQTEVLTLRFPPDSAARFTGKPPPHPAEAAVVLTRRGGGGPFADALAADNVRFTTVRVVEAVRVTLVTGDIGPEDVADNFALPLLTAMTPRPREGDAATGALQVTHLSEDGLRTLSADDPRARGAIFRGTDCVILSNVGQVPGDVIPELGKFVQGGGLLVVFCGDRMLPAVWNEELFRADQRLLPAALDAVADPIRADGKAATFAADTFDYDHPALADLKEIPEPLSPSGVSVNRFFRLRPAMRKEAAPAAADKKPVPDLDGVRVLARYTDRGVWDDGKPGSPAILERRVGQGRVLLFTTAAGQYWNDWATDQQRRSSFVILVQGLFQAAVPDRVPDVTAGRPWRERLLPAATGSERAARGEELRNLSLARRDDPAGRSDWTSVSGLEAPYEDGSAPAAYSDTRYAGVYRVSAASAGAVERFAVNPVAEPGDLARAAEDEIRRLFPGSDVRTGETAPSGPGEARPMDELEDPNESRPPFTPFDRSMCQAILGAMMLLMVVETVLARKFAHHAA